MARNENYKMLQIPTEAHTVLKEYCKVHGYKMGKLVEKLIIDKCQLQPQDKVLKVNKK